MTPLPPDEAAFKQLARAFAATVHVVTMRGPSLDGAPPLLDGFTATAVMPLSIHPPLIAIAVQKGGESERHLLGAAAFAVNLLAPAQAALSGAFATPHGQRPDLFATHPWHADADGAPLLEGCAGAFSARLQQVVDVGDHQLVIGHVTAIHIGHESTLLYAQRAYGRFTPLEG